MKKKVLFVVHQLNYGGVQKALLSALDAIDYETYDVTLYVRKKRLDLLSNINKKVGKVIVNDDNQHYYRRPYSISLLTQMKLCSVIGAREKADKLKIVLSQYVSEKKIQYEKKKYFSDGTKYDVAVSYIQGYPAKLLADCVDAKRKIMFFHGSVDENHELHQSILNRINAVVGVNEGIQIILKELYPAWKEKMTYLTNYVSADEVRVKSQEFSIDMPKNKMVLCTCGRLSPVKGFDLAIKAAKILKDSGLDFLWYFVGDGPERNNLERMVQEYHLENNIVFAGMQANPYPWMRVCDIYVQPSYEEAHPLSIIEAQILCKPVVSTKTVGGKYLVQDGTNGVVCEINEVALADSIQKLIISQEEREAITERLQSVDYAKEFELYKKKWEELLEG